MIGIRRLLIDLWTYQTLRILCYILRVQKRCIHILTILNERSIAITHHYIVRSIIISFYAWNHWNLVLLVALRLLYYCLEAVILMDVNWYSFMVLFHFHSIFRFYVCLIVFYLFVFNNVLVPFILNIVAKWLEWLCLNFLVFWNHWLVFKKIMFLFLIYLLLSFLLVKRR